MNGDMEEIDKREINEEKEACGDWFHVSISLLLCPPPPPGVLYMTHVFIQNNQAMVLYWSYIYTRLPVYMYV